MGGIVAVPMLIKTDISFAEIVAGIRAAVDSGADIISISGGGPCGSLCNYGESFLGTQVWGTPNDSNGQGSYLLHRLVTTVRMPDPRVSGLV
jgi:hypothetical protein